jgi:hypothetical protein
MSTNQPPGGQPEGASAYAQPQDPWGGSYEQGLASMPTDPIPDPYAQSGGVWSQETVGHGGQYGYVAQPPQRSKAGMIIVIFLAVVLLGGGGGYLAWYITQPGGNQTSSPAAPNTTAAPTTTGPAEFDPHTVEVGDCLLNKGTNDDPDLEITACTTPKSLKVIKISTGARIPEGPGDRFSKEVTSVAECANTGYSDWYGYQHGTDDSKDVFFCLMKT